MIIEAARGGSSFVSSIITEDKRRKVAAKIMKAEGKEKVRSHLVLAKWSFLYM